MADEIESSSFFNVTFESKALPSDWSEVSSVPVFEGGLLHVRNSLSFKFALPGLGWDTFRLEIDALPVEPIRLTLADDCRSMAADFYHDVHFIGTYRNVPATTNTVAIAKPPKRCTVLFELDRGTARILVNGQVVVQGSDPMPGPALGFWTLALLGDWLVYRVSASGDNALLEPYRSYPARHPTDFQLEVAIDFNSDAKRAAWTEDMLHRFFAEFRSWGVKRCHWIWHGDGYDWLDVPHNPHARKTIDTLGHLFPATVIAAHANDIELIGVFKPFEVGEYERFAQSVGADRASAFMMARKPSAHGEAEADVVTRIDLVKEDDRKAAFEAKDIVIFVSDDNETYERYEGPVSREDLVENYPVWEHTAGGGRPTVAHRKARVLRFSNLDIRSRYVVLRVDSKAASFANALVDLIHVFGPRGELRNLTIGLPVPRQQSMWKPSRTTSDAQAATEPFGEMLAGIPFGESILRPSANLPGCNAMTARHILDSREAFIAFARGKARGLTSLSPSFQESRDWWLSQLKIMLDAGADGIELRVRHHQSPLTWAEFGFEPPVRDAFLARYGVDLWATDDFDKTAWRTVRGEGYTELCRQAAQLAHASGKTMGVHIGPMQECEALDIHWDWRAWLDEGLADRVTMKELWPNTRLAEDVLSHSRPRGIPVFFSPYANTIWSQPDPEGLCAHRMRLAHTYGYDGFQFYESAAITLATEDGRIVMTRPRLREIFQARFAARDEQHDA